MLKYWLKAFRLRTLPLALSSIGMGSFLAAFQGNFNLLIAVLCALTTLLLQILSNLANDYGDSINGADHALREGPQRAVQAGVISLAAMKRAMVIFATLSLISGLSLLYYTFRDQANMWVLFGQFLGLGILSIIAAITYTAGKKPYGYAGLGDLSVLIFFGWVGVLGTYFLHTLNFDYWMLLPSTSIGLLAVAVLNVNNIRDITSDKIAGKNSIPVRIGRKSAVRYHIILLSLSLVFACVFMIIKYQNPWQFLFLLSVPLMIQNALGVHKHKDPKKIDPFLKKMAITALLFMLTFGTSLILIG